MKRKKKWRKQLRNIILLILNEYTANTTEIMTRIYKINVTLNT